MDGRVYNLSGLGHLHIARTVSDLAAVQVAGVMLREGYPHGGRIIIARVGVAPAVAAVCAYLPLVGKAFTHCRNAEGDGVAVFVGLLGNTTLDIVGILYIIAIAVAIPPGSLTATHLPLHKGGLRERADVPQLATTNVNGGSAINDRWIVY